MLHHYRSRLILLGGDVLTLLAFVYIGQRDHEMLDPNRPFLGMLLPTAVFVLPWVISALILRAYPHDVQRFLPFMGRSLNVWLVAAPLSIFLRSYLLGRAVIPTVFVAAALGFGGAMMLGWRALFAGVLIFIHYRQSRGDVSPLQPTQLISNSGHAPPISQAEEKSKPEKTFPA